MATAVGSSKRMALNDKNTNYFILFVIYMESYNSVMLSCSAMIYTPIIGQVYGSSLKNGLSSRYQYVRIQDPHLCLICLRITLGNQGLFLKSVYANALCNMGDTKRMSPK